jgi:hypothetical protein
VIFALHHRARLGLVASHRERTTRLLSRRPYANINDLFPHNFPLLKPVCSLDASYRGLLSIGKPRSVTGIVITLGGTVIFAKTRIQRTTALSSMESEIVVGCEAGKHIKYFRKLFTDLRFALTGPTPTGEDNQGTVMIAHHRRPSGRTRHMDLQYFATQEWVKQGTMTFFNVDGTANSFDALSQVLYRILHQRHCDRLQVCYGSPYATHATYRDNQ